MIDTMQQEFNLDCDRKRRSAFETYLRHAHLGMRRLRLQSGGHELWISVKGSFVVETFFTLPGLVGRETIDAMEVAILP
jgi:ABC-type dipeptide/oligopeptide/nickel transport system permease component